MGAGMKANAAPALAYILEDEGSEFNVSPNEPGGASKFGVSVTTLSDWNIRHGKAAASIADDSAMTPELAGQIYAADFLEPIHFDDLPAGVDYRLADICINLGVTGGLTLLQLALGMWPITGTMDDATTEAIKTAHPEALILALSAAWIAKKHESPNWGSSPVTKNGFGHGWSNRNAKATVRALAMVTA